MKPYSDLPTKRTRQIVGDTVFVLWCWLSISLGRATYRVVDAIGEPARKVSDAAGSLGNQIQDFGKSLPKFLSGTTNHLNETAGSLQAAGNDNATSVHNLAVRLGWGVALLLILVAVVVYLIGRLKWIREAGAASRMLSNPSAKGLLAQRALMNQPLDVLLGASSDPVGDFRNGNLQALAGLEARRLGLKLKEE